MKRMIVVLSALLFAGFNGCSEAPHPLPPAPQPPVPQHFQAEALEAAILRLPPAPQPPVPQPVTINIYLNGDSQSVQPVQTIKSVERIYLDGSGQPVQPAECVPQPLVQVPSAGGSPAEARPVITRPLVIPNPAPGVPPVPFNSRGHIAPAVPGRQPRRAVSPAATEPQVTIPAQLSQPGNGNTLGAGYWNIPAQPIPAPPPQRFQIRDF